jgi:hypothetical protein
MAGSGSKPNAANLGVGLKLAGLKLACHCTFEEKVGRAPISSAVPKFWDRMPTIWERLENKE